MKYLSKVLCFVFFACAGMLSVAVNAVTFDTIRVYLHPKESSVASLSVFENEDKAQSCSVEVVPAVIDSLGYMQKATNESDNNVASLVRFAPKRFSLEPRANQKVKFVYRRRPNSKLGEFYGLIKLKCTDKKNMVMDDAAEQVNLSMVVAHHIPLVVRTNDVRETVTITHTELKENGIDSKIQTTGARAVTGRFEVTERASGALVTSTADMTIYPSVPEMSKFIPVPAGATPPFIVSFIENSSFGGELKTQKLVE
ncbi:MAG: hypothetical protein HWE10_03495 [Gammaproteobacteria bacterium]|nr:hypothetical protein [Gammaproteobacteria bacterium]